MNARIRPARLAALLLAALPIHGLAGCGKSPNLDAPAGGAIVPESYPVRSLFVALEPGAGAPKRTDAEALARAREALAKLRARGASFEQVAREMSDDRATAVDGGWLGFVADWTGDPAAVVGAARSLAIGAVSEPLSTPGGRLLLQRLSREEGRAVEAKVVAPIDGFAFAWHDVDAQQPASRTRDAAYADAAGFVVRLRAQAREGSSPLGAAAAAPAGGSEAEARAKPMQFPVRRATSPGFERLADAVLSISPGEVTDPIDTPQGWLVARRLPYARCYVRHLVVTTESSPAYTKPDARSEEQARAIAAAALGRIRRDPAAWDAVVREVSEEAGSRSIGGFVGDLSNVLPPARRAAPEFEDAVWRLAPGETSGLVTTRFGIHILRRVD